MSKISVLSFHLKKIEKNYLNLVRRGAGIVKWEQKTNIREKSMKLKTSSLKISVKLISVYSDWSKKKGGDTINPFRNEKTYQYRLS